jgi:hypothetical protein
LYAPPPGGWGGGGGVQSYNVFGPTLLHRCCKSFGSRQEGRLGQAQLTLIV